MGYKAKNKARYKEGREIKTQLLYDCWADLYRIKERVKGLKKDLERECKAYYKYDELVAHITEIQKAIIIRDELETLKNG